MLHYSTKQVFQIFIICKKYQRKSTFQIHVYILDIINVQNIFHNCQNKIEVEINRISICSAVLLSFDNKKNNEIYFAYKNVTWEL